MIVVFSARAQADVEHIGDYIAQDNPQRAASFIMELVKRCRHLADMPYRFPLVPRYEHTGVRRFPHGAYLVFYHVSEDAVEILHILNGAQDFEAILFPET
ncbi:MULTISPECIES: type II toxin-antitoxin system RelE/ParE family toxin [unclassified Rhizobium]|uniref:type II toxin-antitoxin system RelE/ParE family toxin n=1 Tax=unclassified Rhizobium TaxID=2613769 RepID=UPI000CDF567A|nr:MULTISPECIES: type II toxin-antitoxin system RelE/ParE family toxin [Rhizobium]AVA20555.1 toxin-antitoxin system toxin RelE/ParE family protein [Rhizobium sp. NXC24]MDK4738752.1 type II toxin-antitoxin system RelE/ParE family toxin [Rhizobium sp. CNPSo 3464]UWU21832.1 type II toxin-antitoxin system RelE/ParE family toxin [Rhizobium tropici]